jgi:hypothetical protein
MITFIDNKKHCLTLKKTVCGWFVSRSFAEISFEEIATQMQEVKRTVFSRVKFGDDRPETVSKRVCAE